MDESDKSIPHGNNGDSPCQCIICESRRKAVRKYRQANRERCNEFSRKYYVGEARERKLARMREYTREKKLLVSTPTTT